MDHLEQRNDNGAKRWMGRIDSAARELNAFLLVLAIGLAALDFTCFFAFEIREALPSPARVSSDPSVMAKPTPAAGQTFAALPPTRPPVLTAGF